MTLDERIIEAQALYEATAEWQAWAVCSLPGERVSFPYKHVRDYYEKLSGEGFGDPIRWKKAEAAHAAAHAAYADYEVRVTAWRAERLKLLVRAQTTPEWERLVDLRAQRA